MMYATTNGYLEKSIRDLEYIQGKTFLLYMTILLNDNLVSVILVTKHFYPIRYSDWTFMSYQDPSGRTFLSYHCNYHRGSNQTFFSGLDPH